MSGSVKNKKKERKERKEEIETSFDYSQGMMRGFPFKDLEKNPKSNIKARRKSLEERDWKDVKVQRSSKNPPKSLERILDLSSRPNRL